MPRKTQIPLVVKQVESAFDAAAAALKPLAPHARFLLGCSAGGDSTALLALAASRAKKMEWEIAVVHVDHRQRAESSAEAEWVRNLSANHGVETFIERFSDELAETSPLTEEVMREARFELFRRRAADFGTNTMALAHHADDRAETFLIRLLAGSGPTGLAAIRPVEEVSGLTVARPLLAIRRENLRAWLRHHGLEWHEDPTNESLATKRGWIRNALIPSIRNHIGLDPTDRIARAAELIDDEAQALDAAAALILKKLSLKAPPPAMAHLNIAHSLWREAGALLQRQLLRQWLWSLRKHPHPPGFEAVSEALAFVNNAQPRAELRTIEHIHVVHLKTSLLAFPPEINPEQRRAAGADLSAEQNGD